MANEQGQTDSRYDGTGKADIRSRFAVTLNHPTAGETGRNRDNQLDQREPREISDQRRGFSTENRLAIGPAMEKPGASEKNSKSKGRNKIGRASCRERV